MTGFDWPSLMQAGMQGLKLMPEQFWQLTPGELRMMLGQGGVSASLSRAGLDALLDAFPDQEKGECDD